MSEQPLLFDLGNGPPRPGRWRCRYARAGTAALDQAQRRADAARYQEVTCRSALNRVKGMPFNWTLNPVPRLHARLPLLLRAPVSDAIRARTRRSTSRRSFSSRSTLADVLRRELDKPSWTREQVAVGTATDPYQPIEGHYKLTRRSLEALLAGRTPIGLVTKGPMVVRDADLLAEHRPPAGCTVYMSVPTVDEEAWASARAGNRASAPAVARCAATPRGWRQRRRADGAGRSRLHHATVKARSDDQSDRGSRRRVHGREPPVPEGRHEGSLHGLSRQGVPRHGRRVRTACTRAPTPPPTTCRLFAA